MIFGDYKFLNELKINGEETDDVEDYTSEKMPEDDEVSEEETNDEEESEDGEEESNDLEDFTQEDFEDDEPEGGEESNDEPEENSDESGEETNNEEESEDLEDFTQEDFDSEDAGTNEDDEPEGDEESEDTNNEDTENDTEENIDNVNNTLKDMEKDLFSDLTPQQMAVKNSELLTNYIDLYDTLVLLATSVSKINKTNDNIKVIELISDSLDNLKEMVNYVITTTYVTRTYIENLTNYKKSLVILQQINTMLKTLIVKKEKN